ncbi:hypothetical protein CMV_027309 [Castanea mollissima]|uniref:Receptor-like serine/threonine-protein kinase n=1 Tax=Castanea mollissima TaxID=60419 RepID=A0A8J4VF49_9ROSI|nr:hypothetical protein CMV_027309 [Castanea mollissima]
MDISIFFLLLCLLQTLSLSSSNTLDTLKGTSLSVEKPSDKLVSENGEFAAGFFPVGDNAFSFAIWLNKSSTPTVVWMANRDEPVNGRGSVLSILADGQLILTNSLGITIWTTKAGDLTSLEVTNLQLQLQNTGNLVLHNSKGVVIWQSFDAPSDTLLPQQALTMMSSLISRKSQDDYSSGNYKLFFDYDNVLRLLFQGPTMSSLYWPDPWLTDPGQAGRSMYNTSRRALLHDSGYFESSDHFQFNATDFGVVTHRRLTLDPDGNLRLYSLQKMNGSWDWVVTWQAFSDPCRIHGICGPNSLCSYDPVSGRRCSCLQGFNLKDETDWSYGCEPEFSIPCNHTDETSFVQLAHAEFYGSDIFPYQNVTFQFCQEQCLNRCDCNGFQYNYNEGSGYYNCYPKYLLMSGHQSPNFVGDFYLRLPKAGLFYSKIPDEEFKLQCSANLTKQIIRTYENKTVKLLLWFATTAGGMEVTCVLLVWLFLFRTSKHPNPDPASQGYLLTTKFKRFTFDDLRKATRGFKEVIGRGAGGTVYKGVLPDQRVAAIKQLDEANQGEAEFLAESPGGMHASDSGETREHKRLVTLVKEYINIGTATRKSRIEEIIDPMMPGKYDKVKMELLVKVALQCVAEDRDERPSMKQVVEMLIGHED